MDPSLGLKRRVFDRYACVEQYRLRPQKAGSSFVSLLAAGRSELIKDLREVRNIGNGRSLVFEQPSVTRSTWDVKTALWMP